MLKNLLLYLHERIHLITGLMVVGVGLTTSLVYLCCLSNALPLGLDSALAAKCIFAAQWEGAPIWGKLLRLSWVWLPGSIPFRLALVSAIAGGVAAGAVAFTVRRVMLLAFNHTRGDYRLNTLYYVLVFPAAAFFVMFLPEVFSAATHVGPYAVELALAFSALALAIGKPEPDEPPPASPFSTIFTGLMAGLAVIEGWAGVIALPFVATFAWIQAVERRNARATIFCALFAFGIALAIGLDVWLGWRLHLELYHFHSSLCWLFLAGLYILILFGIIRRGTITIDTFLSLAIPLIIIVILMVLCLRTLGNDRAADVYVRNLAKQAEGRRWLVSDGAFDALLRFYLPRETHIVTFAREHDQLHGEEIERWIREENPSANEDVLLLAELGPAHALDAWLCREQAMTNCTFATIFEPPFDKSVNHSINPLSTCWRPEANDIDATAAEKAWRASWAEMAPLLDSDSPASNAIRQRFAVHGNAVGTMLLGTGKTNEAWAAYAFAHTEMDRQNLSILLNMDEMARTGKVKKNYLTERIAKETITELSGIKNMQELRRRLSEGGRLYIQPETHQWLSDNIERRRRKFWSTPSGQMLHAGLERLKAAEKLTGDARMAELTAIIQATTPALNDHAVAGWLKNLFLGQIAQMRGGKYLLEAQKHYRTVLDRDEGGTKLAFDRLLAVDMALGDHAALEDDALRILRRNPRHGLASALAGSARLMRGESASALRFLGNAERLGLKSAAALNDMALALSRLGRHDEALAMARRAVAAEPKNHHVRATLDEVTKNMKKTE